MPDKALDPVLAEFIRSGDPPITVSFSSMPLKDPDRFRNIMTEALAATGNRAVVLTGISGMSFEGQDHIMTTGSAPHRELFGLSKGIVHHGGVGTMAEALLSGVPQVIMPFNVDQPFWAHRLHRLGYALAPLSETKLTVSGLTDTFRGFEEEAVIDRARTIGSRISAENGLSNAAAYIETTFGQR